MFIKYPCKIQIYKVKPWCMYFKYEGEYYMIHTSSEEDTSICLYRKELNEHGNYTTVCLKRSFGIFYYRDFMGKPYKFINKNRFVYELTKRGLVYSIYSKSMNKRIEVRTAIYEQIEELKEKLMRI